MRWWIAFLCLPSWALTNAVTVYEASGSSQPLRPVSVMMAFSVGEIANYPKPRINGVTPAAWQSDIFTRWADGSVQTAVVSLRVTLAANGSASIDFVNDTNRSSAGDDTATNTTALTQAQMLAYDTGGGAGSWGARIDASVNGIGASADVRTMIGAGSWSYWLRGPVVTAVIARDVTAAFAYNFGWQWNGTAWQAPSTEAYKSLLPVYEVRFYPDADGAGSMTNWAGVYVDAQIWNASTTRIQSIPLDSLALKTGASGQTTAYSRGSTMMYARRRWHAETWSGTAPGSIVTDLNFKHLVSTRLVASYDLSLQLSQAQAWDSQVTNNGTRLNGDEPQFCTNATYCGLWMKYVGTTGARGEVALMPQWYVSWLYAMGDPSLPVATKLNYWKTLVIAQGDAAGSAPIHYLETDSTRSGTNGSGFQKNIFFGSTPGVGHPPSINARPVLTTSGNYEYTTSTTYGDGVTILCQADPCDGRLNTSNATTYKGGWTADGITNFSSHAPSLYAMPYLLTGSYYYYSGMQLLGSFHLTGWSNGSGATTDRRHYWGLMISTANPRAQAWAVRDLFWAYVLSRDGEAEKDYFKDKLLNNSAYLEGYYGITDGPHPPTDATCKGVTISSDTAPVWCVGQATWYQTMGISGVTVAPSNPLWMYVAGGTSNTATDGWVANVRQAPSYMGQYMSIVWSWIAQSKALMDGTVPAFQIAREAAAAHLAGRVLSPDMMPGFTTEISYPVADSATTLPQTWAAAQALWNTDFTLDAAVTAAATSLVINSSDLVTSVVNSYPSADSWFKIEGEWLRVCNITTNSPSSPKATVTICAGGRGIWGTPAVSHAAGAAVKFYRGFWFERSYDTSGGYPVIYRGALALMAEVRARKGFTPRRAYEWYSGALANQQSYTYNPQWAFAPRDEVTGLRVTLSSGQAVFRYVAPNGGACRVAVSTDAAAPDDSGDAVDVAHGREHRFTATGLSAGQSYRYRISCGTAQARGALVAQ